MEKSQNTDLPPFFNYKEENSDNGYETIQDFYLSWLLRCADIKCKNENLLLHKYSNNAVFALIYGKNDNEKGAYKLSSNPTENFKVTKVKTIRQLNQIDLIAEIEVEENSQKKQYVLNIENKWYSSIRNGQLEKANDFTKRKYDSKEFEIINLIVFCDYEKLDESTRKHCKDTNYKVVTIPDIKEIAKMDEMGKTGNALFDEYWFKF